MTELAGKLQGGTSRANPSTTLPGHWRQAAWFVGITAVAFLVPFLFTSELSLDHDLYYLVYFAATVVVLSAYVFFTGFDLKAFVLQNWRLSLLIGAASTAFVVWNVLARNDSTPRPDGTYFAFELAWRGVAYGIIDALLLTAFPGMVAFSLLNREVRGVARRLSFSALALFMVLIITAAYHLGYAQFREDGVRAPELGNTIISVPLLVSVNPVGSVVANASMHVAAVAHAYETDVFLPPQTSADQNGVVT